MTKTEENLFLDRCDTDICTLSGDFGTPRRTTTDPTPHPRGTATWSSPTYTGMRTGVGTDVRGPVWPTKGPRELRSVTTEKNWIKKINSVMLTNYEYTFVRNGMNNGGTGLQMWLYKNRKKIFILWLRLSLLYWKGLVCHSVVVPKLVWSHRLNLNATISTRVYCKESCKCRFNFSFYFTLQVTIEKLYIQLKKRNLNFQYRLKNKRNPSDKWQFSLVTKFSSPHEPSSVCRVR